MFRSVFYCFIAFFISLVSLSAFAGSDDNVRAGYRLDSGDKISITVFDESDLSLKVVISGSGTVSYPFLKELKVKGLTLLELEKNIIAGLKDGYLIDPKVTVSVLEYRPFFIHGEVKDSGGYPYQPGLTLRKAITLAGGFTERASKTKIKIIRETDPHRQAKIIGMHDSVGPGDTITIEQSFF